MAQVALLFFLAIFPSFVFAENAQLNSAIQAVSSQTVVLSGAVSSLSQHQTALIQKYHLTNAGQCGLFVVGVTSGTTVPISFLPPSGTITAVQGDLLISSSFTVTGVTIGPAGTAAGKSVQTSTVNGVTRVIIFGLNTTPIGPGVLATVTYSSLVNTPKGIYPITLTNVVASDTAGNTSLVCGTSGAIKL